MLPWQCLAVVGKYTALPMIIGKVSINYDMTTPKSCYDVPIISISSAISFKSQYLLNVFPR